MTNYFEDLTDAQLLSTHGIFGESDKASTLVQMPEFKIGTPTLRPGAPSSSAALLQQLISDADSKTKT